MESFLFNRTQKVLFNGAYSESGEIFRGVPQGAKLGPLMFNLMVNDLSNLETNSQLIKYADDLIMILPLKIHPEKEMQNDVNQLRHDLGLLNNYYAKNDLKLNCAKSKALIVGKYNNSLLLEFLHSSGIEVCEEIKYLGFNIDKDLKLLSQIDSIAHHLNQGIAALRHMRDNTNMQSMLLFYHAHIQSHLMYSSFALLRCRSIDISRLQILQNAALKIIFDIPRSYHTIDLFIKYAVPKRIMSVIGCIYYSAILMVKRIVDCTDGSLPTINKSHSTRTSNVNLTSAKSKLLKHDVVNSGCALYNQIPLKLKLPSCNINDFRAELKLFILQNTNSLLKPNQFSVRNFTL
ncbi:hypothetical protein PVAND_017607 [Polypedilum vanderplanki]|nr:hypothetical protein PVAND_017607 [Polypedilum vanderplanki]